MQPNQESNEPVPEEEGNITNSEVSNSSLELIEERSSTSFTSEDLSQAKKEEEKYFKKPGELSAFQRSEAIKDTFASLAKVTLLVLTICLVLIIVVRVLHIVGWQCMLWLSEEQIKSIDQLISYIIVGSVGSSMFKYFQENIGIK